MSRPPSVESAMKDQTPDFTLNVQGVQGFCSIGEAYAKQQMADKTTPVLSCEGPCIRGDIARRAADLVAKQTPFARACHGETFFVPHSSMASWVKTAERVLMIDGCFLKCHGRALSSIVPKEKIVQIDAMPLHNQFCDKFLMDEVPEEERNAVAKEVADKILAKLKQPEPSACRCGEAACSTKR